LLREFNIAFAKNDIGFIIENISDNVLWNIVGDKRIEGKDTFADKLKQKRNSTAIELHIKNIITHGNTGSANGILTFENKKSYAFCDVYILALQPKMQK
jgi:hypothetical protein